MLRHGLNGERNVCSLFLERSEKYFWRKQVKFFLCLKKVIGSRPGLERP